MMRLNRIVLLGAVLAAGSVGMPGVIFARSLLYDGAPDADHPLEGVQPGRFQADGEACVKQCPDDRLPCDPPSFKRADGRCADQWR